MFPRSTDKDSKDTPTVGVGDAKERLILRGESRVGRSMGVVGKETCLHVPTHHFSFGDRYVVEDREDVHGGGVEDLSF